MRYQALCTLIIIGLLLGLPRGLLGQSSEANTDYVLRPSDLIRVQIFQEADLERSVRITQENTITLPLIGTVDVKGRTVRQTEELIRGLYDKDYLVNPQVNLTVLEYSESTVQIVGAVNRPGAVPFPPEQSLTLVEAIARAGGHSRIADLRKVRLSRTTREGLTENYTINVDDLMKEGTGNQWFLIKGDVIFVPERLL